MLAHDAYRVLLIRPNGTGLVALEGEYSEFGAAKCAAELALEQAHWKVIARVYATEVDEEIVGGVRMALVGSIVPAGLWRHIRDGFASLGLEPRGEDGR